MAVVVCGEQVLVCVFMYVFWSDACVMFISGS